MALTREQILDKARNVDLPREQVNIPGLGEVWIRGMSGTDRDRFEESNRIRKGAKAGQQDMRNFRAKLAVRCIVDEKGNRLLNDSPEDIEVLGRLPAGTLNRIAELVNALSGNDAEEIDDLKNDSASPAASTDSASSSPSN